MNPYDILNIPEKASEAEIKKAYRKLAAKHHPDKGGDEAKFKQINEAYSMIENPQRRQEYEAAQNFGGFGEVFGNFGSIFEGFFGGSNHARRQQSQEQTDEQITFDLKISLDQIKKGITQRVIFSRNRKCQKCEGHGGEKKQTCILCEGSGIKVFRIANMIQQSTCHDCFGTGFTFENKCNFCDGAGAVQIRQSIKFNIKQDSS